MYNLPIQSIRSKSKKIIILQAVVTTVIFFLLVCLSDIPTAYSGFVGGVICLVTNGYFVRRFFFYDRVKDVGKAVISIYMAEFVKLILSGLLLVLAFLFFHVEPLPCLLTYFMVHCINALAPITIFKGEKQHA